MDSEQMRQQLQSALYPNGIKHPQQGEWEWMLERVRELQENYISCSHWGKHNA